eukprot:194596-Prorocentrum_minimum.AAC.2
MGYPVEGREDKPGVGTNRRRDGRIYPGREPIGGGTGGYTRSTRGLSGRPLADSRTHRGGKRAPKVWIIFLKELLDCPTHYIDADGLAQTVHPKWPKLCANFSNVGGIPLHQCGHQIHRFINCTAGGITQSPAQKQMQYQSHPCSPSKRKCATATE